MDASTSMAAVSSRVLEIQQRLSSLRPATQPAPVKTERASFEGALATAREVAAPATPAAPARTGKLNSAGIPVDLAAYGNGKIPASALAPIGKGDHRLWTPAAQSFQAMTAAAAQAGVTIKVSDSYRSYAEQQDVARRKGLYSNGGLAAKPGTSDHGWGLSLDLGLDSRAQAWMRANAPRYGFHENVAREPWHWTYKPKN